MRESRIDDPEMSASEEMGGSATEAWRARVRSLGCWIGGRTIFSALWSWKAPGNEADMFIGPSGEGLFRPYEVRDTDGDELA